MVIAAMAGSERAVSPRTVLQWQNEAGERIYRVTAGRAVRCRALADGRRHLVGILLPGDICGVSCLHGTAQRSSVEAGPGLRVQSISRDLAAQLVASQPDVALWLFRKVSEDTARADRWLTVLSHGTAVEKIAAMLLDLHARLAQANQAGSAAVRIPLTQQEIADCVGLTLPHVSRTLTTLRKRGVVRIHYGMIELPDLAAFADCVSTLEDIWGEEEHQPGRLRRDVTRGFTSMFIAGTLFGGSNEFLARQVPRQAVHWLSLLGGIA
jgi:CRP-like cAMP-binding protein